MRRQKGIFASVRAPCHVSRLRVVIADTYKSLCSKGQFLSVRYFSIPSAPSKARLCQSGVGPAPGSPGQAPGTECCVASGNAGGEAYTGSARAAMRKREGIEPRYEKNRGCRRA